MSTPRRYLAAAFLGFIAALVLQLFRSASPGDPAWLDSREPEGASFTSPPAAVSSSFSSGLDHARERNRPDAPQTAARADIRALVESASQPDSVRTPVTPERRRRFQDVVADEELRSAGGQRRIQQLVSAGLSVPDAEGTVRRYYFQIGACVLDAIETRSGEENLRFEDVFADIERALQDPAKQGEWLFALSGVGDMLGYCDLVASQAAGLQ